jgi:putative Mn2+ efflux pump MntP
MEPGIILMAIGLGFGLAMDAFSVSLANGLHEPKMKFPRVALIAGTFAVFQGLMPLIGWVLITTVAHFFGAIEVVIPWIAFGLLGYIGGKMIYDGVKCRDCEDCECGRLTFGLLMVQGIATSIDAMSGGVTMATDRYLFTDVLVSVAIISAMTFAICVAGIYIGKVFGTKLANKASLFGGSILILIGIIILAKSFMS